MGKGQLPPVGPLRCLLSPKPVTHLEEGAFAFSEVQRSCSCPRNTGPLELGRYPAADSLAGPS